MLARALFARAGRPGTCLRCRSRHSTTAAGGASSDSTVLPIMSKLRADLKTAMINKDANRLSVLRAIIADLTNRAKTNSAAKNPSSTLLLSVLSKHANSSRDAAAQFTAANRADLADKEISQANVLQEYIGGVETAGEEEMRTVVSELVKKKEGEGKVDMARIREAAMKVLEEERRKALDMKALMRVIKDAVG